ncbi:hypothetical protein CDL12_05081 [Handroanthus impetiginosus]|uniref:Uncharacterized protein n=1 Tax=Handroanthus impetiginosus TaxID=429701 RepID=A0A2G9HY04_9LAMI|nr:hypothetical protein CDL12_05081 [Handroanthus impetiginosus]
MLPHNLVVASTIYPVKQFYKYAILGDDICIAISNVVEVYLSTLTDLGLTISLVKSLVSDVGDIKFSKKYRCEKFNNGFILCFYLKSC